MADVNLNINDEVTLEAALVSQAGMARSIGDVRWRVSDPLVVTIVGRDADKCVIRALHGGDSVVTAVSGVFSARFSVHVNTIAIADSLRIFVRLT